MLNQKNTKEQLLQQLIDLNAISKASVDAIKDNQTWLQLRQCLRYGRSTDKLKNSELNLEGKKIYFAGSFRHSRPELQKMAKKVGVAVTKSLKDKDVDIIICGSKSSGKEKTKIQRLGISHHNVYSEQDFKQAVKKIDSTVDIKTPTFGTTIRRRGGIDAALQKFGYNIEQPWASVRHCSSVTLSCNSNKDHMIKTCHRTKEQIANGISLYQAKKLLLAKLERDARSNEGTQACPKDKPPTKKRPRTK